MIYILLFLSVIAVGFPNPQQATPPPVVERCITSFTESPTDWTFDGTIITYRRGDGIHGFRADTPSRYYIAFDSDTEYGQFGALSPDGHWLASFIGRREYTYSMMFNMNFYITHIRVVSTLPNRETYLIPFERYQYAYAPIFTPVLWQDNTHFVAYSDHSRYMVNPFEATVIELSDEDTEIQDFGDPIATEGMPTRNLDELVIEDLPRAFLAENPDSSWGTLHVTDLTTNQVYDTCIETRFAFAVSPAEDQIAVSGREGGFVYVIDLSEWAAYRINLATNHVVAWVADS